MRQELLRCSTATTGRRELSKSDPTGSLKTSMAPIPFSLHLGVFILQVIQFSLVIWYRTLAHVAFITGPLFPGLPPHSVPTVPTNPEDFLSLSRPATATASRNLFVGNVSTSYLSPSIRVTPSLAPLPLPMARFEGPVPTGGNDLACRCCPWARWPITRIWNRCVCKRNRRRAGSEDVQRVSVLSNNRMKDLPHVNNFYDVRYEFNGRPLKVHFDRFSASQASTVPTSPAPGAQFSGPYAGTNGANPPNYIPIPLRYPEFMPTSGATSPYDSYPPYLPIKHQVQPQMHPDQQTTSPLPNNPPTLASPHPTQPVDKRQSTEQARTKSPVSPSSNSNFPHPGRIALPPPSVAGFSHPPTLPPSAISPLHHPHHPISPLHHPHHLVTMTPHGLPPMTPSMPSFTFLPQPSPTVHGGPQTVNPPSNRQDNPQAGNVPHILTPYMPFSPGVTMSPGALWGRPGAGANPYAAVGAPIHIPPQWVQHGSPLREDTGGYFPPVPPQEYFPFVPPSSSGLANEVVPDGESSAGDTDVGIKESGGSGLIQPGGGGMPNSIRTDAPRQESSDSILRTEDSPVTDPNTHVIANSLGNLTIGSRKAWTLDSKVGTLGEPPTKGRTQTSLPAGFGGGSGSESSSSSASASYPHPIHRAESDPIQTLENGLQTQPPGPWQERRASFAEIVSEGNTPGTFLRKKTTVTSSANSS